jgi:hypothetical protein
MLTLMSLALEVTLVGRGGEFMRWSRWVWIAANCGGLVLG